MSDPLLLGLRTYFGWESFRPGQAEAIQDVLAGRHTVVVMPSGAGKSLISQLAALHLPGTTLVISLLIALMHDQVNRLDDQDCRNCGPAARTAGLMARNQMLGGPSPAVILTEAGAPSGSFESALKAVARPRNRQLSGGILSADSCICHPGKVSNRFLLSSI